MSDRGILTFAYGPPKYRRLAVTLGRSLALHCPTISTAVVCDGEDEELRALFDRVVPLRPEWGGGFAQKLHLDAYAPFAETLFLDADSLVVRDLEPLWEVFAGVPVGVVKGRRLVDEHWYGDVATICRNLGLDHLDNFNGGLYYVRSSREATEVYARARELAARYAEIGLEPMRGGLADEPVMAIALALSGIKLVPDPEGRTMATLLGLRGSPDLDVLAGTARFDKHGAWVTPAVVHFCEPFLTGRTQGRWYRRERRKLALRVRTPLPHRVISAAVDATANPPYKVLAALRAATARARAQAATGSG